MLIQEVQQFCPDSHKFENVKSIVKTLDTSLIKEIYPWIDKL